MELAPWLPARGVRMQKLHRGVLCAPLLSSWRKSPGEGWAGLVVLPLRWTSTSSKAALWGKAQHEGALPPPCFVRKDPRVPHTARRGA